MSIKPLLISVYFLFNVHVNYGQETIRWAAASVYFETLGSAEITLNDQSDFSCEGVNFAVDIEQVDVSEESIDFLRDYSLGLKEFAGRPPRRAV